MSQLKKTENTPSKLLSLELTWWLFSIALAIIVVIPIYLNVANFQYYFLNILYVLTFITLSRYIFLLKLTFLSDRELLKGILIFLSIPFVFYLVQELNLFQTFLDENGPEGLLGANMPLEKRIALGKYVQSEIMLFGMGSIISGVIFPFRLVLSIWRGRNNAGV